MADGAKRMDFFHLLMFTPILGVSLYDIYISIKTQSTLAEMELNPVGQWLIALDDGVALFMTCKCLGNILAILFLAYLMTHRPRLGWPAAWGLVVFQVALLYILLVY